LKVEREELEFKKGLKVEKRLKAEWILGGDRRFEGVGRPKKEKRLKSRTIISS
jgi:hypothetical protein